MIQLLLLPKGRYCTFGMFGVHLRIVSFASGSGTQNITHNLFHEQLKWHCYTHAEHKSNLQNFVTDPKIMKMHFLLPHKTNRKHDMVKTFVCINFNFQYTHILQHSNEIMIANIYTYVYLMTDHSNNSLTFRMSCRCNK